MPLSTPLIATGEGTAAFPAPGRRTRLTPTSRARTLPPRPQPRLPRPPFSTRSFCGPERCCASTRRQACSALTLLLSLNRGQTLDTSSGNNSISLANASYATMLLTHATQLYDFAKTSPMQVYQTSVPAAADIYGSSRFADSLVWAALWVSLALKRSRGEHVSEC